MKSEYSNVSGDFDAVPIAGTKRIALSNFANNVISGDLSALNFIDARIYSHLSSGTVIRLPTGSLSYSDEQGLTLHEMVANFSEGESVAVFMRGRDKGFDEAADAYKTTGSGEPQPVFDAAEPGDFFQSSSLQSQGVVRAEAGVLLWGRGRLDQAASDGTYFLQFYDSATVPADGPVTVLCCVAIEHTNGFSSEISFEYPRGKVAGNGISFSLSLTEFDKTAPMAADYLSIEVEHKGV